jgi:hypothetical protein
MTATDHPCNQCGAQPGQYCWDQRNGWVSWCHPGRDLSPTPPSFDLAPIADALAFFVLADLLAGQDSTIADRVAFAATPFVIAMAAHLGAQAGAAEATTRRPWPPAPPAGPEAPR